MMPDDLTPAQAKTSPPQPNPALKSLEVLVGEWNVELVFPADPATIGRTHTSFTWLKDGAFLMMHTGGETSGTPWSTCIMSRDDSVETYSMLYYDWRGTSRIYEMSLEHGRWKQWRKAPGFSQRFIGTFSSDLLTITAHWEKSFDGSHWEHDFDLTYTKVG
jgi:hypothetical protein